MNEYFNEALEDVELLEIMLDRYGRDNLISIVNEIQDALDAQEEELDPNLQYTMDARTWAAEFCKIFNKLHGFEVDEGWIISWMANAIMCGYDHASKVR